MNNAPDPEFQRTVEAVMREIVSASHRVEGSYVRTPLLYPSGGEVVVRVSGIAGDFFVTDFGSGYLEAEMMGAPRSYVRQAAIVSRNTGVSFDTHAFFAVRVPIERLAGAIGTIANCAHEAVAMTAYKMAERASVEGAEVMVEKLERVFAPRKCNGTLKLSAHQTMNGSLTLMLRPGLIGPYSNLPHPMQIPSLASQ